MSIKMRTGDESTGTERDAVEVVDEIPSHASHWGTDGDGVDHYWSVSAYTMYVDGEQIEAFDMHAAPYDDLVGWAIHVMVKRGYWQTVDLDERHARKLRGEEDI